MANRLEYGERGRRVYGRRLGKPLRNERADVINNLLPRLEIPPALLNQDGRTALEDIFGVTPVKTHFEIGFGNGEHLKWKMEQFPDHHFIGAEIYINGMSAFLKSITNQKHDHVRVLMEDAIVALNSLPDASIDYLYVLNPDPWPKKRHWGRRMVGPENLPVFARVLKPGGILLETTDVGELAEWMAIHTANHPAFEWLAENPQDWRTPPNGWSATRYENKGKNAGRQQSYLTFKRK